MEASIIIEKNSVFNNKQNAEIRQILQNVCHNFNVIYSMKMLIKKKKFIQYLLIYTYFLQ